MRAMCRIVGLVGSRRGFERDWPGAAPRGFQGAGFDFPDVVLSLLRVAYPLRLLQLA